MSVLSLPAWGAMRWRGDKGRDDGRRRMIWNAIGTTDGRLRGRVLDFLKVNVLIYRDETGSAWHTGF